MFNTSLCRGVLNPQNYSWNRHVCVTLPLQRISVGMCSSAITVTIGFVRTTKEWGIEREQEYERRRCKRSNGSVKGNTGHWHWRRRREAILAWSIFITFIHTMIFDFIVTYGVKGQRNQKSAHRADLPRRLIRRVTPLKRSARAHY